MKVLGIHLGHNSHFCVVENGKVKNVFETERYYRIKAHKVSARLLESKTYIQTFQYIHIDELKETLKYFLDECGYQYDCVALENQKRNDELENLKIVLKEFGVTYDYIENVNHHLSHACSVYYTSPFKKALVFSYDGHGNDGRTIFFHGEGNKVSYLDNINLSLGKVYNNVGFMLNIRAQITGETAGKSMGLTGYGKIRKEWIPYINKHILDYLKRPNKPIKGLRNYGKGHIINSYHLDKIKELKPYTVKGPNYSKLAYRVLLFLDRFYWLVNSKRRGQTVHQKNLNQTQEKTPFSVKLINKIIIRLDRIATRFNKRMGYILFEGPENKTAQDLMRTFQYCWTQVIRKQINMFSKDYENLCVAGGCALNGITNYNICRDWGWNNVFFVPNPSDCGTGVGAALKIYWDKSGEEFQGYQGYYDPYVGSEIYDLDKLDEYLKEYPNKRFPQEQYMSILAKLLQDGKIIGVINGKSEIGPRALGNRSIFCNPVIKDMRDIINDKVKHREWFRPFAPISTLEDSLKYFTNEGEIPYMSVVCYTRKEYRDLLPSVTHVDGSARLQTVKKEQNPFVYDLIKEFEKLTGYPILLNTSLNPKGEPILNYLKVGIDMTLNTDMDYLAYNGIFFGREEKIKELEKI